MKDVIAARLCNPEIGVEAEIDEVEQSRDPAGFEDPEVELYETRLHSLRGAVWAEESDGAGLHHPGAVTRGDLCS